MLRLTVFWMFIAWVTLSSASSN